MLVLAGLSLAIWVYLMLARGGFWRAREREADAPPPPVWPEVVVVIPARDEAETIGATIASLLAQDYAGPLRVVLVDDGSSDGAAEVASKAAGATDRLDVVTGAALPVGWTGKLWALAQGVERAGPAPRYLLLTDADIAYDSGAHSGLVARAEQEGLVLNSLMARLRCESFAERFAIPAFVFFFQMLYPFAWVNDPARRTAAAAGGCMLARRDALEAAGGIAVVRGELIDDCALARRLKQQGPIRLSLAERVSSLRSYPDFSEIRRMVVRSAYAQLRFSPALLAFTCVAMAVVFVVPPAALLFGSDPARFLGFLAYWMMIAAFAATVRDYKAPALFVLALPAIAALYTLYTIESALASARGRGGLWKGRYQESAARAAAAPRPPPA